MAKTASINVRTEPEIKARAEELFGVFGITVSDAINIFLHVSLMRGGLPFEVQQIREEFPQDAVLSKLAMGQQPSSREFLS